MPHTHSPHELLETLSRALGLEYEPQDWGIVNADADRLVEFLLHFEQQALEPTQAFEMAELVLASANEALLQGKDFPMPRLVALIQRHQTAFEHHVEYWAGLEDPDEFPLGRVLRETLHLRRPDG